jgi:predicted DNA binding protein
MIKGVLTLRGVGCWAARLSEEFGIAVNVHACRLQKDARSVQHWVEILSDGHKIDKITDQIKDHTISSDIIKVSEGRSFGLVVSPACVTAKAIEDLTCVITAHRVRRDGLMELEVLASGEDTLKQIMQRLGSKGIEVSVLEVTSDIDSEKVTAREEQVVRRALEMGYFDYPRKIRQRELASACGICSSTLAELLRRAERNIMAAHTTDHDVT